MTTMTAEQLTFAAFHESGHALATVLYGGTVEEARLVDDDPTTHGHCIHVGVNEHEADSVAWAGGFAESLARSERGGHLEVRTVMREVMTASGARDQAQIDLAKMRDPSYFNDFHSTEKHIRTCWRAVTAVALKLFDGPINHSDVTDALGLSSDPDIVSHQLHLIKSGHAPGTFVVTKNGETLSVRTGLR